MVDMRLKSSKDLLHTARERYRIMAEADRHNRLDALEDIRFVNIPGAQWNENMKTNRGDRPCYEYNKTRMRCKRIINDMRDNRPAGKVRGVEGDDPETAEIYEGLIRNIWNVSHGDNATDYAAEYQVEGGMGAWRVNTEYSADTAFNQDIIIEMIDNPFSLYADPGAKDMLKRDAKDWVYTTRLPIDEFERLYGKKPTIDFVTDGGYEDDYDDEWTDEETVRIAEYWYKKPVTKDLWMVEVPGEDGEMKVLVVDSESDEARGIKKAQIKDKREVKTHQIMMCIMSGDRILEGPVKWAGRKFPWVMVYGEYKVIDGRKYWWGLPRFAKDAQRNYNISKTAIAETIAQAPKGKWWATSKQAAGHTAEWAVADRENMPYMLYESDPLAPGTPQRMGGADVPVALLQQAAVDNEDLKDVMGLPDSSMGQSGDEKSGRAIYARQQQGEVATFNYRDNMTKAVEHTMEILIDLIPEIYDTERELRILGKDGAESYKRINQIVWDPKNKANVRINDLAAGRYDVTVTTGPAFSTQRQEAAEMYMGLTQGMPEIMQLAGDLIFKAIDLPYADEISDRLQTMLPPQIQQMLNDEDDIPPEVKQMMQQAQMAMEEAQKYGQMVQAANTELQQDKAINDKVKAEIQTETANVRAAKAEFEAQIAEQMAGLTKKEADMTVKGAELSTAATQAGQTLDDRETGALEQSARVDEILAQFMSVVDQAVGTINSKVAGHDVAVNRQPVGGQTRREGGRLVADVQFDDGTSKSISAVRDAGGMKIVPTVVEPFEPNVDQEE